MFQSRKFGSSQISLHALNVASGSRWYLAIRWGRSVVSNRLTSLFDPGDRLRLDEDVWGDQHQT